MANFNKVILAGNLTRDPQLSYLPSQTPVVEFGLAINRRWRGQNGEQREETCFVDCRCYGKQAETFNQYMSKGQPVLVEGRLQFDSWEGPDGQKRSKHRVVVQNYQFLGGPRGAPQRPAQQAARPAEMQAEEPPEPPPSDDDIPF
jgi:single-strand DNA-binding protein